MAPSQKKTVKNENSPRPGLHGIGLILYFTSIIVVSAGLMYIVQNIK